MLKILYDILHYLNYNHLFFGYKIINLKYLINKVYKTWYKKKMEKNYPNKANKLTRTIPT
jgi:hypothetical protein